jgi:D-sedoheptulose 7-phosphate isomerase
MAYKPGRSELSSNKNYSPQLAAAIQESIEVKKRVLDGQISTLNEIVQAMSKCLTEGNKVLLFGNGGSAADSQHIAAELVSKFLKDRKALPAIALTTDTSILTSVANDYSFDEVFARQIEALGRMGDVALAISTSGNSPNVLKAVRMAKEKGLVTIGLTGLDGGKLKSAVDICFHAPSKHTPRIQEIHITVAHAICDILEQELG